MAEEELEEILDEEESSEESSEPEEVFVSDNVFLSESHLSKPVLEREFLQDNGSDSLESIIPGDVKVEDKEKSPYEISSPYEKQRTYSSEQRVVAPIIESINRVDFSQRGGDLFVQRDSGSKSGRMDDSLEVFQENQRKYEAEKEQTGVLPFRRERRDRDISFI